jgi:hypothetical protein
LIEKVLSGLQSLDGIHAVGESGIAGARQDDISSGRVKNACQGKELLRAIREAVKKNKGTLSLMSMGEQAAATFRAEREGGLGFLNSRKSFDRLLVAFCGLGDRNELGDAPKPDRKPDGGEDQNEE